MSLFSLQENDAEAQAIAKAGQAIVRELVQPNRLYCYYFSVLQVIASWYCFYAMLANAKSAHILR